MRHAIYNGRRVRGANRRHEGSSISVTGLAFYVACRRHAMHTAIRG